MNKRIIAIAVAGISLVTIYFADSTYKILVNKNVGMAFDYATLFASSNSQISRWVVANKTFVDQDNQLTYGVQYQTHLICVQQ